MLYNKTQPTNAQCITVWFIILFGCKQGLNTLKKVTQTEAYKMCHFGPLFVTLFNGMCMYTKTIIFQVLKETYDM